jgi:hypothetical protein
VALALDAEVADLHRARQAARKATRRACGRQSSRVAR